MFGVGLSVHVSRESVRRECDGAHSKRCIRGPGAPCRRRRGFALGLSIPRKTKLIEHADAFSCNLFPCSSNAPLPTPLSLSFNRHLASSSSSCLPPPAPLKILLLAAALPRTYPGWANEHDPPPPPAECFLSSLSPFFFFT